MAIIANKIEFDLTIRKYEDKSIRMGDYVNDKKPEFEVVEELKFKSLNVVEIMRKLLDYIK